MTKVAPLNRKTAQHSRAKDDRTGGLFLFKKIETAIVRLIDASARVSIVYIEPRKLAAGAGYFLLTVSSTALTISGACRP